MAVVRGTSTSKPVKKKKPVKPVTPRGGSAQVKGTEAGKAPGRVPLPSSRSKQLGSSITQERSTSSMFDTTVRGIEGVTSRKGKTITPKKFEKKRIAAGMPTGGDELSATRQAKRRARIEDRGGKKTVTYTGSKQGSEPTSTGGGSKPKKDIFKSTSQDRPGGGFKDVSNYQTPASFDKHPDTRFTPLPGGSSEGGGGGGATVTGQSLSGLTGSDLDSILKGAKKGRRQKRRRGVE
jgi:hypothetical protein